jgi:hypothetical protein
LHWFAGSIEQPTVLEASALGWPLLVHGIPSVSIDAIEAARRLAAVRDHRQSRRRRRRAIVHLSNFIIASEWRRTYCWLVAGDADSVCSHCFIEQHPLIAQPWSEMNSLDHDDPRALPV